MGSVLQEWVEVLPLREQGALLTGIRGCDLVPKEPLDSTPRLLVAFLRYCVMNPADDREVDIPGAFFRSKPPPDSWRPSELGHLPLHWYAHLMHAFEVVAYRCVDREKRIPARTIYYNLVDSLHLNVESAEEMADRLGEDRIAAGTVVS